MNIDTGIYLGHKLYFDIRILLIYLPAGLEDGAIYNYSLDWATRATEHRGIILPTLFFRC